MGGAGNPSPKGCCALGHWQKSKQKAPCVTQITYHIVHGPPAVGSTITPTPPGICENVCPSLHCKKLPLTWYLTRERPAPPMTVFQLFKISHPWQKSLPDNLSKLIARYSRLLAELGWEDLMASLRGRGKTKISEDVPHLMRRLLWQYKHWGAPVSLSGREWTEAERSAVRGWGPFSSSLDHFPFLCEGLYSMVEKGKWEVIPYYVAKELLGLLLIPPDVKEERDRRPWWLGDYS